MTVSRVYEITDGFIPKEHCDRVVREIRSIRDQFPISRLGVATGPCWQGPKVQLQWWLPELYYEGLLALERLGNFVAWGNVMEPGSTIGLHDHSQAVSTGVLFLSDCGGAPLCLLDREGDGPVIEIDACQGRLVRFAPLLEHQVDHQGESDRFSLAYNVMAT